MRRECQEIIPNLFLGPLQTSRSLDILKGFSITHMYVSNSLMLSARSAHYAMVVLLESAYATPRKHIPCAHVFRSTSVTSFLTSRIARSRI